MIARVLLFAALIPLSALAQLQVFLFDGTNETQVGAVVNVGTAGPGDSVETRFRVRNIGTGAAVLETLSLAGSGFSFSAVPSLPYTIAPYDGSPDSEAEFRVVFNPTDIASYSAFLVVNTINVILEGTGTPSAVLKLAGSNIPLAVGAIIDFGPVASGKTKLLTFELSNPSNGAVSVNALSVTGTGFKGPIGTAAPISIAAGQTVSFQVAFSSTSGHASQGALAAASQVTGTGTLTMTFQSSVKGISEDPAIQFLSGPLRQATVSIAVGDSTVKFVGNQGDLAFQTGATAGTIAFTLILNGNATPAAQATLTIGPAPVSIQSATSIRLLGGIVVNGEPAGVNVGGEVDISIAAADNTYSASQLAFTFFDKNGNTMQPGVIRVDATSDFQLYFNGTTTGGAFGLLAKFTVTGDVTQIIGTNVAITNSVGVTTTQHISIGN